MFLKMLDLTRNTLLFLRNVNVLLLFDINCFSCRNNSSKVFLDGNTRILYNR